MSLRVCALAWRRGWHCTTSASGLTLGSVVLVWLSPTCWDGDLTIHTKRLSTSPKARLFAPGVTGCLSSASSFRHQPRGYLRGGHPRATTTVMTNDRSSLWKRSRAMSGPQIRSTPVCSIVLDALAGVPHQIFQGELSRLLARQVRLPG